MRESKGRLKMPRWYVDNLKHSGDADFEKLSRMNGEIVDVVSLPQPAISREFVYVGIKQPCEMTIPAKYIEFVEETS